MTPEPTDYSSREQQLDKILAEYIQAIEAGQTPDKQGFLARYSEFAVELEEFFADQERLNRMAAPFQPIGDAAADVPEPGLQGQTTVEPAAAPTIAPGTSSPLLQVGTKVRYFGDYELLEEIARGGMGVVYKARQVNLNRIVALKMILSGQLASDEDVKRFYAEAEAAAKLDHPNIVPIFEVGRHEGQHYFSMAFVDGESLARRVAQAPLAPREAAELMKKVAQAIAYAHVEGVIHRDLKPANILLARGRERVCSDRIHAVPPHDRPDKSGHYEPRITDFGLAKRVEADSDLTATGQVLGTPGYMPPEQAGGKTDEVGPLSDVYSLGAVLYCVLTGRPPFQASNPLDTLMQVLQQEPIPVRKLNPSVPRDLETICLKCLQKDSRRRYASARELADDLDRYLNGDPIRARRVGRVERTCRWLWKRRRYVAAVTATAAVVMVLAAVFFGRSTEELIAAGDELHTANKHREAVEQYRKGLWWTHQFNRFTIQERMVRCYQELGDTDGVVETALEMLQFDPDAWFGEQNYAVAQAVVSRIRSTFSNLSDAAAKDRSLVELAELRLEYVLHGPHGTEAERQEAEETLIELREALGSGPFVSSRVQDQLENLPTGAPEELLRRADDPEAPVMERAAAAYAAGQRLEDSGDTPAALAAYERPYQLLRSRHPVYAGINHQWESSRPRSLRLEPPESRLLRHMEHTIRRLDPNRTNRLRGGLRFRIAGVDLPPDLGIKFLVSLWDATDQAPEYGTQWADGQKVGAALGSAPVQLDQTAWVGVADGKYRLSVQRGSGGTRYSDHRGNRANRLSTLLDLDFSDLPKEVEIRGSTLDLPPIRARLLQDIALLEPQNGATINLQTERFRWSAVQGAKSYRVHSALRTTRGSGAYYSAICTANAESTSLSLLKIPDSDIDKRDPLSPEQTITWSVHALDATDRCIAKSTESGRTFRIAGSVKK